MYGHVVKVEGGWQSRLGDGRTKFFANSGYSTPEGCRKAAIEWIESEGATFDPSRTKLRDREQSNNTSGVNGVYRSSMEGLDGVRRYFWAAFYTMDRNGKHTRASRVFYYGQRRTEDEAHKLADKFRRGFEEAFDKGPEAVMAFWKEWDNEQRVEQAGV